MQKLRLKFVYEKGIADKQQLELYDAAVSLEGIARALTITTHAFINGEIRTRGDAAHGAKLYLLPPGRGSFVYNAAVWISEACVAGIFYDFVRHTFEEAIGRSAPIEDAPSALRTRIEPTLGELPAVLESPLRDMHRPIQQHPKMTLTVKRPRGEVLVQFDTDTGHYLQPRTIDLNHPVIGNVTRYNTLSRWGRFYDRSQGHTVSFFLSPDVSERERSLITWSLHESNLKRDGTLYLVATAVVSPTDQIKRYNISRVSDRPL